ncbi:hypothetical protein SDC9_78046 [bioreactor metagenome]|uniref:Uncharacterized protein n=1 Tax=bioreactor metagenome TaxID=1076179 RepID=A0A644YUG7_9ZZZZ
MQMSAQRHVQRHHQRKAKGEKHGADVGVHTLRHFGNELLHDDIEHGTGGKAQGVGKCRCDESRREDGQSGADRLHNAG